MAVPSGQLSYLLFLLPHGMCTDCDNQSRWSGPTAKGCPSSCNSAVVGRFSAVFLDSVGDLVGALGRNNTLTGRRDIWQLVLTMVQNPLCASFGCHQ